jgi:chromosome partitioning protein
MITFAIAGQKGGVGKTTTCLNLGYCLAEMGKWVLMVDLDPQASLTQALNIEDRSRYSIADVFNGKTTIPAITQKITDRLYLAPSNLELARAEMSLAARSVRREYVLKDALVNGSLFSTTRFNVCLIDSPPSVSYLAINSIAAARWLICPTLPTEIDWRSVKLFLNHVNGIKNVINPNLAFLGLIVCQYSPWLNLHKLIMNKMVSSNLRIIGTIKKSIYFADAAGSGQPIKRGDLADEYRKIAMVLDRCLYGR